MTIFHVLTIEQAMAELKSGSEGLTSEEESARLGQYGRNELVEKARKSVFTMFPGSSPTS